MKMRFGSGLLLAAVLACPPAHAQPANQGAPSVTPEQAGVSTGSTNQTGTGLQPLKPLRPLTPPRPLNTPNQPLTGQTGATNATTPPAAGAAAATEPATGAKGEVPLKITGFMTSQVPGMEIVDDKGSHKARYFRAQFKILDPAVTALETATVYLFSQKKEAIASFTEFNKQATILGTNYKENVFNFPNMPQTLTGLEKNKTYNLVYVFKQNEVQYKYAIIVIGTKDKVVADIIPGSAKIADFVFDGKEKLAQ